MITQPQRDIVAGPDDQGGEMTVSSQTFQTEVKKVNRTAWKGEYEKAITRYHSMKFTASAIAIIAGMEFIGIVILLWK